MLAAGLNRLAITALIFFLVPQLAHSQENQVASAPVPVPVVSQTASTLDRNSMQATASNASDMSLLPDAPDAPKSVSAPIASDSSSDGSVNAAISDAAASFFDSQDEAEGPKTKKTHEKKDEQRELALTGLISYGDHKLFGAAVRCNIWLAGVEYDRHIWKYFLKARVDYVVEVLPFVLLSEPVSADVWGNPLSPNNKFVHGFGFSPFGFRYMWRSNAKVKPYLIGKAGGVFFPIKVLSPTASYANFAFQGDFGLQIRMNDRMELRVDPLEYFHFSNAFLVESNPGLDELSAKVGLVFHLDK